MADAVIFDVDGTLVDTNYLHAVCWWEAFRQYGHGVDMSDVHGAIGMGSDKLLDHLLPADRDRDADEDIRTAHRSLYATYWPRLRAFDGAADLLRACAERGMKVVLASSAASGELAALRAALGADDVITAATSSSEAEESKPAPDIVSIALERADVDPSRAVFVGDTIWDVQACREAGVACVAVRTGGICAGDLRAAGAVEVYEDTADLLRRLDQSPLVAS
jgi:HAD superfamily hydrolase (TIGR01509 family)